MSTTEVICTIPSTHTTAPPASVSLDEQRENLWLSYQALDFAGQATTCLDGLYVTLFDEYVKAGIKNFGKVSGHVQGIGSGKTNTVFSLASTPFYGARRGSLDNPGRLFGGDGKVDAFGVIVIIDAKTDKQKWHMDGALIRPVSILSTATAAGEETLHAVFDPAFENGTHQYGFLLQTAKDVAFAAEVVAGARKRGEYQPRMLMRHGTVLTYQKEQDGASQSGWMFSNNKAQEVAAGIGEDMSTCSLRVQLQGSCKCSAGVLAPLGWNIHSTYAGFDKLDKRCREFLLDYFGHPVYKSGSGPFKGGAMRSRGSGGATYANLSAGQAKHHNENVVEYFDSAGIVDATLRMTVGVVTYDTPEAKEAKAATPVQEAEAAAPAKQSKSIMDQIRFGCGAEVAYIKANAVTIDGNVLVLRVREHEDSWDEIGREVPITDVIRENADGLEIGYRATLDVLLRVTVYVVHKVSKEPIGLTAKYAQPVDGGYEYQAEPQIDLTYDGDCLELPYPLQKEAGEEIDGWNLELTIDGKQHTVKLRYFIAGQTYTAEAEDVPAPAAQEPVTEAQAPMPATTYTAEAAAEAAMAPEETISDFMAGMDLIDPASAVRAVQNWGFTDMRSVKRASPEDIDDMVAGLGWAPLYQRRFRRKWEQMDK